MPHILHIYIYFKSLKERTSAISRLLFNCFKKLKLKTSGSRYYAGRSEDWFFYDDERVFIKTDSSEAVLYFVGDKVECHPIIFGL